MNSRNFVLYTLVAAVIGSLSGCTTADVSDVFKDKNAYRDQNFSVQTMPADVLSAAKNPSVKLGFQELTVTESSTLHSANNSQVEEDKAVLDFVNEGGGILEETKEWSRNDISYALDFNDNYVGVFTFRTQQARNNLQKASFVSKVNKLVQFPKDVASPQEDSSYLFEYKESSAPLGATDYDFKIQCQAGKFYPANTVLPKLTGNALDLDCTNSRDGVVQNKFQFVFLSEYGVYVPLKSADSVNEFDYKITDIVAK